MASNREKKKRLVRYCFGIGLLALILGIGNVVVGGKRLQSYEDARKRSLYDLNAENPTRQELSSKALENLLPVERSAYHQADLRYQFYNLCILGGKVFLVIACGLFLIGLFIARSSNLEQEMEMT